jgi:hypothetical protein
VTASKDCSLGAGANRSVSIQLTAHTSLSTLLWQHGASSADVLIPSSGTIPGDGTTTVTVQETVEDSVLKFEVLDGSGNVILRVTLSDL